MRGYLGYKRLGLALKGWLDQRKLDRLLKAKRLHFHMLKINELDQKVKRVKWVPNEMYNLKIIKLALLRPQET